MEYTKNYKLPQWVETDRILMEDFNQMCRNMEAGLDSVKSAGSADVIKLEESIQQIIGSGGFNCRIETGSYVGTGTVGTNYPLSLEFSIRPLLIVIASAGSTGQCWPSFFVRGVNKAHSDCSSSPFDVVWSDRGVSWSMAYLTGVLPEHVNNREGETYHYIVFGYDAA